MSFEPLNPVKENRNTQASKTGKAARTGKLLINVPDCWKYLLIFMVFVKSMLIQSRFIHKEICQQAISYRQGAQLYWNITGHTLYKKYCFPKLNDPVFRVLRIPEAKEINPNPCRLTYKLV